MGPAFPVGVVIWNRPEPGRTRKISLNALERGQFSVTLRIMETSSVRNGASAYGSTRHPFRASLPRHVLRELPRHEPEVARALGTAVAGKAQRQSAWRISVQDVKDFLIAYTACLLAAMTFLG